MIQNIEISKINPHYDNPRKELGDLTELAESIKNNGIFQNLTIVPWFSQITGVGADDPKQQEEMGYIVVIGHRRLAAAKLAGLTEVPCSISNMSYRKQISTMLLENMQRSDLTVYEQAQGFQMMLDLGESINDISHNTGFSETTVRRRVKLLELDKEKFRESVNRGASLMDYAELEKIQDIVLRNKVLEKIGTSDFNWELKRAIDKETSDKNNALLVTELKKFATEVEKITGLRYVTGYSTSQQPKITIPDDVDTVEYFYYSSPGYVYLYQKSEDNNPSNLPQKDPAWLEKQRERDEHRAVLDEISKRAYQLRYKFVREISNARAKKNMGIITEYLLRALLWCQSDIEPEDFADFFDIEIPDEEDDEKSINTIMQCANGQSERNLLAAAYFMNESAHARYYGWDTQYKTNETLDTIYDFLEKFGYEVSEEEQSLRDGTHELFASAEVPTNGND